MDYKQATELLGNRQSRKVANHTTLRRTGPQELRLRLHATDILVFQPRRCILNSGGWRTVTTKARLNEFGPKGVNVQSIKGVWQVGRVVVWDEARFLSLTSKPGGPFQDGMAVNYKGQPIKSFKPLGDLTANVQSLGPLALRPHVVTEAELARWKAGDLGRGLPFKQLPTGQSWQRHGFTLDLPDIRGWELVKEHFVDSSGFGRPGEAALTAGEFIELLVPGHGYFLSGRGQFQAKVAEYRRLARVLPELAGLLVA